MGKADHATLRAHAVGICLWLKKAIMSGGAIPSDGT
jgi:hypothetical protein